MEAAQAQATQATQATQDSSDSTPPRRPKNYGKPMVTVRMPPELKERLDKYSAESRVSINMICIDAIEYFLSSSQAE